MSSYIAKSGEVTKRWYIIDAEGISLGRLASRVATVLRGKHRVEYTTHVDTGDFVIVTNAAKIKLTGDKLKNKFAYSYSGYPGGFRADAYGDLLKNKPEFIVHKAVKGMLPKKTLGRDMGTKLKVYAGTEHPHQAQNPEPLPMY